MRLTRRGRFALLIVAGGLLMAVMYGSRSIEAMIAPIVVALVVGGFQTRLATRPSLTRRVPDDGFVGETRTVRLEFDVDDPVAGYVSETLGAGLSADGAERPVSVDGRGLTYDLTLEARGARTIGPLSLTVTDVLGLTERTFRYPETDEILVYPRVYEITGSARHELNLLAGSDRAHIRDEFESLREYERGDSLRDVHWKTSAKRPEDDLVVKDFIADEELGTVTIVCEATADGADAMAEAAASVALYLLDAGIEV